MIKISGWPCLLVLILISAAHTESAAQSTAGKSFWLCFPQNARYEIGQLNQRIVVTALEDAEVAVSPQAPGSVKPAGRKLRKGETHTFELDTNLQCISSELIENKGVHVGSTGLITLTAATVRKASGDSYRVMPIEQLGKQYMVVGYDAPAADPTFTTHFTIVAAEDNTAIQIGLTALTKKGRRAGEQITVRLDRGQSYTIMGGHAKALSGDLTGTVVSADKPVAMFTGHSCAQVPYDRNFCDVLVEMSAPLDRAGREFIVAGMEEKSGYGLRIVATESNTSVQLSDTSVIIADAGNFFDVKIARRDHWIKAEKPIVVAQYALSFDADSFKVGDPFMTLIPSTGVYAANATVTVPAMSGDWYHYATIILDADARRTLTVNGQKPPAFSEASRVGNSDLFAYRLELIPGVKDIRSGGRLAIFSYGFGAGNENFESYGTYCGPW